jgi:hypothetical protein
VAPRRPPGGIAEPGPLHRPARRRLTGPFLAAAFLAALTFLGSGSPLVVTGATAADDFLRLAVVTTYRVDAPKAAVHVTLDIRATNTKPGTSTTYYYFNTLSFGVPEEATAFTASSAGQQLTVAVHPHEGYRQVVVRTPRLLYRQTHATRLRFDLPGGKPRSDSPLRIGRAHAEFTAWAYGDAGRADVRVVLPSSFDADVHGWPDETANQLRSTTRDGLRTYAVDGLSDPDHWYATIDGSDHAALTSVALGLTGKAVTVHAWPEDKAWADRVAEVLGTGLPRLETAIGLPWPVDGELSVSEVSSGEIGGYGGQYDPAADQIQVSEDLDPHVIVHEAAHAWFNRSVFAQRWINEGLADEYAAQVVALDEGNDPAPPPTVLSNESGHFKLNDWPPPSRIDDTTQATEGFGYDASWSVVHDLVTEVGDARMRAVFAAAAARQLAYLGSTPAETAPTLTPDWRRFLDLLEGVGGSTKATRLFTEWVVTDTEAKELTERAAARARYGQLLEHGADWLPGILVRKPMSEWEFRDATTAMNEAEAVLGDRDRLRTTVGDLGLAFPSNLEPVYETADAADDLDALHVRLAQWQDAADAVRSARDALAAARPALTALGLVGTEPEADYQAALAAFAAGDDRGAAGASAATLTLLGGAEDLGRQRALAGGSVGVLVVVLVVVLIGFLLYRRASRRRERAALAVATAAGEVPARLGPDATVEPVGEGETSETQLEVQPPTV